MSTLNVSPRLLDDGVLNAVEQHAFSDTTREVGGILLGTFSEDGTGVRIQASLPALAAIGQAANLTFTHAVWADILGAVDRDFPELRIVGWYHTHPGHGIFLSGYDKFIHESFFGDRRMSALVIDPHSGELGWFDWEGEVITETSRTKTITPAVTNPAVLAQSHASAARSRGAAILGATALLLAGTVGGYLLGTSAREAPARTPSTAAKDAGALADARASIDDLTNKVGSLGQALALEKAAHRSKPVTGAITEYRVRRGDTLWGIAVSLYGDGLAYQRLAAANSHVDPNRLAVGQIVLVPPK